MSGRKYLNALLAGSACALALSMAGAAAAQTRDFDVPAGDLSSALETYARQSGVQIIYRIADVNGIRTQGVHGALSSDDALAQLLEGTNFDIRRDPSGAIAIAEAADPQSGSAAGDGAGTVEALIVTAQKKEEQIQDVPIAISAFTEKTLQEQKIEGGFDLLKAIPNVTFSKNNFTSYNFSIRGIGTKAVSATTDPGVAVAFNNSAMIVNRLFEQEYFDIERVEVLRGPQGTLYGRNATAGVINVISAKPDLTEFKGWIKGEVGNYHTKRTSAMVNIPLIEDKLALRIAGALTQRDGYGFNAVTQHNVDGRDLWSARVTLGFAPTERFRGNLIWERFSEDDNRARTSKQLCHRDTGPTSLPGVGAINEITSGALSQGCNGGSLYDASAFQAPNGDSLPNVMFLQGGYFNIIEGLSDPYGTIAQSKDLREISSRFDPIYRGKADVFELNLEYELSPELTIFSQTLYDRDQIYSTQDYNRFNTLPVFTGDCFLYGEFNAAGCAGGYFNDPQLGSSNTIVTQDISQGKSTQFSQEFRIQSASTGPVNFSAGVNYVKFKTNIDYYVFSNSFTLLAATNTLLGSTDPNGLGPYIDPNPLDKITGNGQNYFRSQNPYSLVSRAAFGEVYWNLSDTLKFTGGLRYTDDQKKFELWPSQLLNRAISRYGHESDIRQGWRQLSGRLGVDWHPDLSFTDQTMLYAFYSRGYKAGGANPPNMAPAWAPVLAIPIPVPPNAVHPPTFDPEFVDAFEVGAKNALLGGGLIFNADAFYYKYKDYQISQIVDRLALNENYDADVWGLEFESVWSPTHDLRINANLGYLHTRVGDGQKSIDVMNRTQGNPDWVIMKNWVQYPSNCIVPLSFVSGVVAWERAHPEQISVTNPAFSDRSLLIFLLDSACEGAYSPHQPGHPNGGIGWQYTGIVYDPYDHVAHPDTNDGAGFSQDLGGNELPNSPHWTMNVGAQYSWNFLADWRATIRGDAYWQAQSWARIYNSDPYDKLHGWYNANLAVWFERQDGLKIELYAKNLLDKTPITDAFLNSDDSGLTTNVFVLDPRLIGLSIRKDF